MRKSNLKCVEEAFPKEGEENARYIITLCRWKLNVHVTIRRNFEDDAELTR